MEKLEFIKKDPGPPPPSTICKRCGKEAKPKEIILIGWRQQDYCEPCSEIIQREQKIKEQKQQRMEKVSTLRANAGIMRGKFKAMTFDAFEARHRGEAFNAAKSYAEEFDIATEHGLFFYGKAGAGKTHLAVAIAHYIIEQKQLAVRFSRVVDLLLDIRQTYNENESFRAESEQELLRKYTLVPLLILDDLGSEKTTEWVRQILYQIVDIRWVDEAPTIITSNFTPQELVEKLDDRIASRIAGMCQMIEIKPHDYRVENAPRFNKKTRSNAYNA